MMVTTGAKLLISLLFVGAFYTTDATISAWSEPVITTASGSPTAAYTFAEDVATGTAGVGKTFAVNSDATSVTFTLLTAGTPFSIASATGVLSLDTALDFETTASYTFEVQAVDATPTTGTATITVTVTDVAEVPAFAQAIYGVNIADGSTAGATLTTVTATDSDGDAITYSIAVGDASGHFSIASTGVITVAATKTLAASTTAAYALEVEAADDDTPSLTGTTTIAVIVQSCSGGSSGLLAGSLLVLMMSFLALLK